MTTNRMGLTPEQAANTFTDEQLESLVYGNNPKSNAYRELLAYRKSSREPIGEVILGEYDDTGSHPDARFVCLHPQANWDNFTNGFKLFAAPPLAVTVPTFDEWIKSTGDNPLGWVRGAMRESYDACLDAILKGNKNV